jgi:ArsR family transcriptional regulator
MESEAMRTEVAAGCLEALGSPTRLEIYRLLVQAGPGGAVVGDLQARLGIPASTLSHHLSRLVRVGLISQQRHSRNLVCRANYERMNGLVAYLSDQCCRGLGAEACAATGAA